MVQLSYETFFQQKFIPLKHFLCFFRTAGYVPPRQSNIAPPPPPVQANQNVVPLRQQMGHAIQQRQHPNGGTSSGNLQITIETGLQLLTESITEDLNRLQSLQVVSNMLRTDFRDTLEDMVQVRTASVFVHKPCQSKKYDVEKPSSTLLYSHFTDCYYIARW